MQKFKFLPEHIGKFVVLNFPYEEHIFGNHLQIGNHILSDMDRDDFYGIYQINWYDDYAQENQKVSYKIKLVPVKSYSAWCPNRSWYTSDIESIIRNTYTDDETFIFDNIEDALKFSLKKNKELYPDKKSIFKNIFNKIFKK